MKKLSAPEIAEEIRATGDDNFQKRVAEAHEIYVASGWPAPVERPKIKDLLAAAHERNKQDTLQRAAEREKNPQKPPSRNIARQKKS